MRALDVSKSVLVHSLPGRRSGVSPDTIPGSKIAMHVFTVPPGATMEPGNALETESAAYIVSGGAQILAGEDFAQATEVKAGDFYFTPVRLPHLIRNPHDEPTQVVLAWSLDPSVINSSGKSKSANGEAAVKVVAKPLDASATAQTRGMRRVPAICAQTTGATQIWMCYLTVEPRERGQPHHHGRAHTAAYTISGRARICFGRNFEEFIEPRAGDFAFDPPGLVHLVDHPFDDEPWKGVLARCPENTVVNVGD
jgi:uncharacterized RmlC-like cupin family protein